MKTAIKERPILFSGQMVKAILDGRKTQTRRIVNPNKWNIPAINCCAGDKSHSVWDYMRERCPYGQPGERLWVRETWLQFAPEPCGHESIPKNSCVDYRADFSDSDPYVTGCVDEFGDVVPPAKWRPSIHMPRWASRITLKIASVRVERLQEISREDAIAEGTCRSMRDPGSSHQWLWEPVIGKVACPSGTADGPVECFKIAWESINGAGSWGDNPWVWCLEFKRCSP